TMPPTGLAPCRKRFSKTSHACYPLSRQRLSADFCGDLTKTSRLLQWATLSVQIQMAFDTKEHGSGFDDLGTFEIRSEAGGGVEPPRTLSAPTRLIARYCSR